MAARKRAAPRKAAAPKALEVKMRDGATHHVELKDRDVAVAFAALKRTGRYHGTLEEFTAAVDVVEQR